MFHVVRINKSYLKHFFLFCLTFWKGSGTAVSGKTQLL